MSNKVAVMAGTPVDTKMGADFLAAKDPSLEIVSYPLSPDPITQTVWQFSSDKNKRVRMVQVFDELETQGIRHFISPIGSCIARGSVHLCRILSFSSIRCVVSCRQYPQYRVLQNHYIPFL